MGLVLNGFVEYVNGYWLDGTSFVGGSRFVSNGLFISRPASEPGGAIIDLKGSFIVPPLADAHSHYPEQHFYPANRKFIQDGIFFVLNAGDIALYGNSARECCFANDTVDAIFAHAGFTCTNGHPTGLYARLLKSGVYPSMDLDGKAYFQVDDPANIVPKWLDHLRSGPDLLKVYVGDARNPHARRGLSPHCLLELCRMAHSKKMRIGAHIETADDFRLCLDAGVDLILHLPGYRRLRGCTSQDFALAPSDAQKAAEQGTAVVTTASLLDRSAYPELAEIQKTNLLLLHQAKVKIAAGSDREPGSGLIREIEHLRSMGIFSNLDLVTLLCVTTPRAIFPHRKVGALVPGYEASFICLDQNPLEELSAFSKINLRVKRGWLIAQP